MGSEHNKGENVPVWKLPSGDAALKISRRLSHLRWNCCFLPLKLRFYASEATYMMFICGSAAAWRQSSSGLSHLLLRGALTQFTAVNGFM